MVRRAIRLQLQCELREGRTAEAQDQVRTRLRSGRSTGVRGMQQAGAAFPLAQSGASEARPETLDENPSGEAGEAVPSRMHVATNVSTKPVQYCVNASHIGWL